MSWKTGPWDIKTDGCLLKQDDKLNIVGSDLFVTRKGRTEPDATPWGSDFRYLSDSLAVVNSDNQVHVIKLIPANSQEKAKLECSFRPESMSPGSHGHGPQGHTGGTGASWTAEEGEAGAVG